MSEERIILAVDGGGTKTDVVIARENGVSPLTVLARKRGGPTNPTTIGIDNALAELQSTIARASRAANVEPSEFAAAVFSLAGIATDEMIADVSRWAHQNDLAGDCTIVSDAELILSVADLAANETLPAVAVISGTGSIALANEPDSEFAVRAGGWGYLLGDEGSAFDIGKSAVRAVLHSNEGSGSGTALSSRIYVETGTDNLRDVIGYFYKQKDTRIRLASLAPLVSEAAEEGDEVARDILEEAGRALGRLVKTVLNQLSREKSITEYSLAMGGGVLANAELVRESLSEYLREYGIVPHTLNIVDDPVLAAAHFGKSS
ncbi:MAG: BadF/BadG/BcrA/BcrD ATPase family protein [Planctomycetota bacterium]